MVSIKNAATFLVLAAGAGVGALVVGPVAGKVLLGWAGCCYAVVAVAYAAGRPGIFLKRPSGGLPAAAWLLFGPFLLPNAACFHAYRLLAGEAPWHEVAPGVYLGRRLTGREAARAAPADLAGVVDLTCELPEPAAMRGCGEYLNLPVLDGTCPTPGRLREAVAFIERVRPAGGVYVHCAVGHGRSATVAVAWLLAAGLAGSAGEALARVRSRRPRARLAYGGAAAVEEFLRARDPT